MKVLQVITTMDPRAGGVAQGLRNLARQKPDKGHVMEIVCLDPPGADFLFDEPVPIHALGPGGGPWQYQPALRHWLQQNLPRYDAVVLHGLWQYPGYALSQVARQGGMPPYFVFAHGMLDPWFQRAPERRFKAWRNWLYWKFIEKEVIARGRGLFFTAEEEMRLARTTFRPYRPQTETVVGFGIPHPPPREEIMREAFEEKCPALKGRPFLLFLGRIDVKKGVDFLVQAFAAVAAQTDLCLVVAGPGLETGYGKEVMALAEKSCPPGRVSWPGMLTGPAKWGALYQCEAFALISHQENFGVAVVEAMACGKPVLISNQVNIWREIEEDKAGFVSTDDLPGAQSVLQRWSATPPAERAAMSAAAAYCFMGRFDIGSAARKFFSTVEKLTLQPECAKVSK